MGIKRIYTLETYWKGPFKAPDRVERTTICSSKFINNPSTMELDIYTNTFMYIFRNPKLGMMHIQVHRRHNKRERATSLLMWVGKYWGNPRSKHWNTGLQIGQYLIYEGLDQYCWCGCACLLLAHFSLHIIIAAGKILELWESFGNHRWRSSLFRIWAAMCMVSMD